MSKGNQDHSPNDYDFTHKGGEVFENGKPHWRDVLTVWMDKREALRIIQNIAAQLQNEGSDQVSLTWCGLLEQTQTGHWPFDLPEENE